MMTTESNGLNEIFSINSPTFPTCSDCAEGKFSSSKVPLANPTGSPHTPYCQLNQANGRASSPAPIIYNSGVGHINWTKKGCSLNCSLFQQAYEMALYDAQCFQLQTEFHHSNCRNVSPFLLINRYE